MFPVSKGDVSSFCKVESFLWLALERWTGVHRVCVCVAGVWLQANGMDKTFRTHTNVAGQRAGQELKMAKT